jgi:3-hydroxyisobutyrate dehydrogenase-like beta-hydroxyacid dehydrogenase
VAILPTMSAAILGLGIIGSAWAKNLMEDGLLDACWNRSPKPGFPSFQSDPEDVAAAADLLMVCVADPPAVESILAKLLPKLASRHLVVQTSTIDPASSRRFAGMVRKTGARYLESPFTGSKPAAEQRKTLFFVGGEPEDVAAAEPILSRLSQRRMHMGRPEQAAAFKLATNLLAANFCEALCESLAMARRAGIADDLFFEALRPGMVWNGLAALKEPKLKSGDFSTQFSVKHMLKDMRLALKDGESVLPLTKTVAACLARAAEAGLAEEDFSALIKLLKA